MVKENEQPDPRNEVDPVNEPGPLAQENDVIAFHEDEVRTPETANSGQGDVSKPSRGEWIAVATLIVVFAQALIYYWTLAEIRNTAQATRVAAEAAQTQANVSATQANTMAQTLTETQKQANASLSQANTSAKLVDQNKDAVIAAIAQSKAAQGGTATAQDALRNAREQFQKDQRPYIWASSVFFLPIAPNERLAANVYFANFGKAPAISVISATALFHGENALLQADVWFASSGDKRLAPEEGSVIIIPPGMPTDRVQGHFGTGISDKVLSQPEATYILENDFSAVVVTRIEYSDAGGALYRTDMCNYRLVTSAIGGCKKHNEIH